LEVWKSFCSHSSRIKLIDRFYFMFERN